MIKAYILLWKHLIRATFVSIIIFIILLSDVVNSSSLDYLADVDAVALDNLYNKIINFQNDMSVSQTFLDMNDTCKFEDKTTINSVRVNIDDEKRLNKIAITIDDSFVDTYTEEILDVLDKHNCKATFFITSRLMSANPNRVFEIIKRGHEIGSHSMTHPPFKGLHSLRKLWEIDTFNNCFKILTKNDACLFRFPSGSFDDDAVDFLINKKMYPIGWSISSADWALKDVDKIYDRITSQKVKSGDIVLLHNGFYYSKETIDKILTYYENKGFSFLKVSDLIYPNDFKVKYGVQIKN